MAASLSWGSQVNRANRPRAGFTLIELLVVIAIIAILASMLFVGLRGTRGSAEMAQCISNVRQLAAGSILYSQENGGELFPGYLRVPTGNPNPPRWTDYDYRHFLDPYLKVSDDDNVRDLYACPSLDRNREYQRHVFPLTIGVNLGAHVSVDETQDEPLRPLPRIALQRPAEQIEFADVSQSSGAGSSIGIIEYTTGWWFENPDTAETDIADIPFHAMNNDEPGYRLRFRHKGDTRIVAGFFDGHARAMRMDQVKYRHFAVVY